MGITAYLQKLRLDIAAIQFRISNATSPRDRAYWRRVYLAQSKLADDLDTYLEITS